MSYPYSYPSHVQKWNPTQQNPYPMNFVQAPSPQHQTMVSFNGQTYLQGLSTVRGPFMFPIRNQCPIQNNNAFSYPLENNSVFAYPPERSVLSEQNMSYVNLVGKP